MFSLCHFRKRSVISRVNKMKLSFILPEKKREKNAWYSGIPSFKSYRRMMRLNTLIMHATSHTFKTVWNKNTSELDHYDVLRF